MKSTIKSAFAILAVALMIMVAVVPIASTLVSEESSAVAIAPAANEYDDSPTDAIIISGAVLNAAGTSIGNGVKVTVTADGKSKTFTNTAGNTFTVTTTVETGYTISEVKIQVDTTTEYLSKTVTNKAYGQGFPTITLNNVTADVSNIQVISNTALISGKLVGKAAGTVINNVYIEGATITGAEGTVKTDANGAFQFYGKVGTTYNLSASAAGTTFKTDAFVLTTAGAAGTNLAAEDYLVDITLTNFPRIQTLTVKAPEAGFVNNVTAISTPVIGYGGGAFHAYGKLTLTEKSASQIQQSKFTVAFDTSVKTAEITVGVAGTPAVAPETGYVATSNNYAVTATTATAVCTGKVVLDDAAAVAVNPTTVVLTATYTPDGTTTETTRTFNAYVLNKIYYVGNFIAKADGTPEAITSVSIAATFTGYTFNPVADGNIKATNAVYFEGTIDSLGTAWSATVKITASNAVIVNDKIVNPATDKYKFYVPENTSVTVEAPSANYEPAKYVNDKAILVATGTITIPAFVYHAPAATTTYTGAITLNGVAVKPLLTTSILAVSTDGGMKFTAINNADLVWNDDKTFSYEIANTVAASDIMFKIAQVYTTANNYAFDLEYRTMTYNPANDGWYYSFYGVTGTEVEEIAVAEQEIKATIKDDNATATAIPGQKVNFYMIDKDAPKLSEAIVKVTLGTATTNSMGVATIDAAKPVANGDYTIVAEPVDVSKYGKYSFTFDNEKFVVGAAEKNVIASEKTTFGYVTEKETKLIISEPSISYIGNTATGVKVTGEATIVGDMYYILTKDIVDLTVYVEGYTFDDKGYVTINTIGVKVDLVDAVLGKIVIPVVFYDVETVGEYASLINVSTILATEGDVVTVSAPSSYIRANDDAIYTDAYVKYTFAAWYVNGVELSKDCNTSFIMIDGDVAVSCDYTVEYVVTSDVNKDVEKEYVNVIEEVEVPVEKTVGIDNNVLIIGICAVVIALIAVIYAVIKKD